jgi:hypothetical protein
MERRYMHYKNNGVGVITRTEKPKTDTDSASESAFVRKANYLIRKYRFTVSGKP